MSGAVSQAAPRRPTLVLGATGLVGSALVRRLRNDKVPLLTPTRRELDLFDRAAVQRYFRHQRPGVVYLAAARVGGIRANNDLPAEFIHENLLIAAHVVEAAALSGAQKLVYFGSSCIYPRDCPQPMRPEHLLSGPLEATNRAYALAKIAGIELCRAYRRQHGLASVCLMPTNLYGPHDRFDLEAGHVLPALLRRMHEAACEGQPVVTVWGTGRARREFLHVDDLADAAVLLADRCGDAELVNVGSGEEVTIAELTNRVAQIVGFTGDIRFDPSRPDGTPRKLLDCEPLRALGWQPRIGLAAGLRQVYDWFREHAHHCSVREIEANL